MGIFEPCFCRVTAQYYDISIVLFVYFVEGGQTPTSFGGDSCFDPEDVFISLKKFVGVDPYNRSAYDFLVFEGFETTSVSGSGYNFSDQLVSHGLSAHEQNVLTTAVVVNMVKSVGIGKSCFIHFKVFGLFVHEIDELTHVVLYTI